MRITTDAPIFLGSGIVFSDEPPVTYLVTLRTLPRGMPDKRLLALHVRAPDPDSAGRLGREMAGDVGYRAGILSVEPLEAA